MSTVRLPVAGQDLVTRLAELAIPSIESWRTWQLHASQDILEESAAELRHRLRGITAAARLYLGAAARGYVSKATIGDVIAAQGAESSSEAVDHFLRALENYSKLVVSSPVNAAEHRLLPHFVLLDDLASQTGWHVLLGELLREPKTTARAGLTGLTTWSEGKQWLKANHSIDQTVMLLDCNLGPNQPSGLATLRPIRSRTLELPVVFLTGYDDAQLALWSLRAGANHFFAKELFDGTDRASLDYFDQFLEVSAASAEIWALRTRVNTAWRALQDRQESGELDRVSRQSLQFAFYLLFSHFDDNRWWLFGTAYVKAGDIGARLGGLVGLAVEMAGGTVPADVRHGVPFALERAVASLEARIEALPPWINVREGQSIDEPELLAGCPYREEELKQPGWRPGCAVPNCPEVESRDGMSVESGSTGKLLILDPAGYGNGWFALAAQSWPGQGKCFERADADFYAAASMATSAVVELCAPAASDGLAVIEKLKSRFPELSVLVVSKSTLSIDAIRAVKSGALDYIDKAALLSLKDGAVALPRIQTQVRIAHDLTERLRPLWLQQRALETKELPAMLAGVSVELKRIWLPGQVSVPRAWGSDLAALTRFALLVFQVLETRAAGSAGFLPIDHWRSSRLLPNAERSASTYVVWLAAQVVEEVARWRYALINRDNFDRRRWGSKGANGIDITQTIEKATGQPGKEIWRLRNSKEPKAKASSVLTDMFKAIGEFESRLNQLELHVARTSPRS